VIGRDLVVLDYSARLEALLTAGIGLWDTVGSATRSGSLDRRSRGGAHAPGRSGAHIARLAPDRLQRGHGGAAGAGTGKKLGGLSFIQLPSSSAAYCAVSVATKQQAWNRIGEALDDFHQPMGD
jgi:G:T/U-mismatch repair DNA glycosylase